MTEMDCHDWKQLAEAARDEEDSSKLMELIRQLNRALDEHMKNLYPRSSKKQAELPRNFPSSLPQIH